MKKYISDNVITDHPYIFGIVFSKYLNAMGIILLNQNNSINRIMKASIPQESVMGIFLYLPYINNFSISSNYAEVMIIDQDD